MFLILFNERYLENTRDHQRIRDAVIDIFNHESIDKYFQENVFRLTIFAFLFKCNFFDISIVADKL